MELFDNDDGSHTLRMTQWVPRPRPEVFAFFHDAGNLRRITPDWLSFRIVSPQPIDMEVGAVIDYRLKVHGLPMKWRSRITAWEPDQRFCDQQVRGPYQHWHHEHTFREEAGGTRIGDEVTYRVPGGPLSGVIHRLMVAPDLRKIFHHRRAAVAQLMGEEPSGTPETI